MIWQIPGYGIIINGRIITGKEFLRLCNKKFILTAMILPITGTSIRENDMTNQTGLNDQKQDGGRPAGMEYRPLGRTGLNVSAVSLGAWEIGGAVNLTFDKLGTIAHGWGRTDDSASLALIERCRDAGVNFIDTAPIYGDGHSEELIGRALRGCRDAWIVCTKGGHGAEHGRAWSDFSRARILAQVDESLRRLRMEAVDVYLLHGPSRADIERGECLAALQEIRRIGKTRFVGVSLGPNDLGCDLIRRGAVDVLQQSISLQHPAAVAELLPAAAEHGTGIVARGVFGAGFLAGGLAAESAFAGDDRRSWQDMDGKRALAAKGAALGKLAGDVYTSAQLALLYVLRHPAVSTVIAGTSRWEHMRENIAALHVPPLSAELARQLESLAGQNA